MIYECVTRIFTISGPFVNDATLVVAPTGNNRIADEANFYNYNTVEAKNDGTILSPVSDTFRRGTFYNYTKNSLLLKSAGEGTTLIGNVDFQDNSGTIEAKTGTIEFGSGYASFKGTTFKGNGKIKITNDAYFDNIQSENLELAKGTFTGDSTNSLKDGNVLWTGGDISGSFANRGIFEVAPTGNTRIADEASFYNYNTVETKNNGTILSSVNNNNKRGIFYNNRNSLFIKSAGTGTTRIGDVNFQDNGGTIEAKTGTIEFGSGHASFKGTTFKGNGKIKITNDAYFYDIKSENLELVDGTFTGHIYNGLHGKVLWTGGDISGPFANHATLVVAPTGKTRIADKTTFYNYKTVETKEDGTILSAVNNDERRGTFNNYNKNSLLLKSAGEGTTIIGNVDFKDNGGTIEAQTGTIEFGSGHARFYGTTFKGDGKIKITNDAYFYDIKSDNLELASGTFTGYGHNSLNEGNVLWTGGQMAGNFTNKAHIVVDTKNNTGLAADTNFYNYGTMSGTGVISAIDANFINSGSMAPGNSPGKLTIDGNYQQMRAGSLDIELAGLAAGSEYDMLEITGTAKIAGSLNISLLDGFNPASGYVFDILSAETINGTFNETSFADLIKGLSWELDYILDDNGLDFVRLSVAGQAAVPVPGTLILMISGLLCLSGIKTRSTKFKG